MAAPQGDKGNATERSKGSNAIQKIAWLLTGAISLFAIENIWIDPWLRIKSHHKLPSFVPEPLGGVWLLVFAAMSIAVALAILCVIFVLRDLGIAKWKKVSVGGAVLLAVILAGQWFLATGGTSLMGQAKAPGRDHTVTLRWNASTTPNVRYTIYRGQQAGLHPDKLNLIPTDKLSYTDTTVDNGNEYYYVVRAVNSAGRESVDSNEIRVKVP